KQRTDVRQSREPPAGRRRAAAPSAAAAAAPIAGLHRACRRRRSRAGRYRNRRPAPVLGRPPQRRTVHPWIPRLPRGVWRRRRRWRWQRWRTAHVPGQPTDGGRWCGCSAQGGWWRWRRRRSPPVMAGQEAASAAAGCGRRRWRYAHRFRL
ncbi:hypothetical protein HK405_014304, partial [Cladochytrium tenue]